MLIEKILDQLSIILGKRRDEIKSLIEEIKSRYRVDDDIAILEIISQYNLTDKVADLIKLLKIRRTLNKIKHIKSGARGISVLGIVESIRFFMQGSRLALILLTDDSGTAQAYILKSFPDVNLLPSIHIGSAIILENVKCSGILPNGQPRLIASKYSSIHLIDAKAAEELLNYKLPAIRLYDIQDILRKDIADRSYLHVIAIYMGEAEEKHPKQGKKILLGSLNDFCKTKVRCTLYGNATDEFTKIHAKPGDIIEAHCLFTRKFENTRRIIARNLTVFNRRDPEFVPPEVVGDRGWWKYSLVIRSPPRFGTYEKNGQTGRYAILVGNLQDGTRVRVLVWNENFLEDLARIRAEDRLTIFGMLEFSGDQLKIHVHRSSGYLEIASDEGTPKLLVARPVVTSFHAISQNTYVNVICKIVGAEEVKSRKLYGVLKLTDGTKTLKMLVWDSENFKHAKDYLNALVKITNVRVERSKGDEDTLVLLSTPSTQFDVIAREFEYARAPSSNQVERVKTLDDLSLGKQSRIIGTVTGIEWIGKMQFCKKCGGLIINPAKQICEMGHSGYVDEKNVASITIDDGFSEKTGIVPISELKKLGITSNTIDTQLLLQKLLGKELCLVGKLKIDLSTGIPTKLFFVDSICEIPWLLVPED
ncbi:MAG: hypothetical protein NDP13_00145 [Crenarchaeota archaeon]|nr:hypothetical protein [Thermoproteota archaeon]MCR8454953.1 hypothetical protein [Thermoproteota archaeon]MCR8500744.1 hypothetical protein [Thermoproteota archaeon]